MSGAANVRDALQASEPALAVPNTGAARGNTESRPRWPIETATAEWITAALPPREHLLVDLRTGRGAMDRTGVWLFGGAGGAGKSYATIALALAVAGGRSWFGCLKATKPGRVLIIAAEDSAEDIRRRVHAIAKAEQLEPDVAARLHILAIHEGVTSLVSKVRDSYAPSDDTASLCAELAKHAPYDLVIVDPYGRIAGVSVDADNAAAAATISALAKISSVARGLVLGITHTSLRARIAAQNGAAEGVTAIRGATGQADYARGVMRLERDRSAIWLSLSKANHVAPWEPIGLRRGDHGELVPLDAVDLAKLAVARSGEGRAAKREAEAIKRLELDDAAARQVLADNPGATKRALLAFVMKARAPCGKDRANDALERVRP